MCGAESRLYKAEIEGTILNVCHHCAKHGKVIAEIHDAKFLQKLQKKQQQEKKPLLSERAITQTIVEDFSEIIKKRREEMKLKQEELAKKLNEKESLIHKIETNQIEPTIDLARKLERFLKVKLVEQIADSNIKAERSRAEGYTLGDFIKIRE